LKAEDGQTNKAKANGIKVSEHAASSIGTSAPEQRPCSMPQRLVRHKKYTGIRRYMNTGGTVLLLLLIFVEWTCLLQSPCTTRGLNIATDYAWMHRNEPIVHFEYGEVFRHALPYIYNMVLLLWKYCSGDQLSEVHQLQECLYKRHIPLNVTWSELKRYSFASKSKSLLWYTWTYIVCVFAIVDLYHCIVDILYVLFFVYYVWLFSFTI